MILPRGGSELAPRAARVAPLSGTRGPAGDLNSRSIRAHSTLALALSAVQYFQLPAEQSNQASIQSRHSRSPSPGRRMKGNFGQAECAHYLQRVESGHDCMGVLSAYVYAKYMHGNSTHQVLNKLRLLVIYLRVRFVRPSPPPATLLLQPSSAR